MGSSLAMTINRSFDKDAFSAGFARLLAAGQLLCYASLASRLHLPKEIPLTNELQMKLAHTAALPFSLFLVACATSPTPSTLQSGTPDAVFASDRSSKEIAECVVSKWENTRILGAAPIANYRPTTTGYRVTLHFNDRLRYMADIDTTLVGSKTKVYVDGMVVSLGKNPSVGEVAGCQ